MIRTLRTPAGVEFPAPLPLPGRIRLLQYSGGSLSLTPGKLPAPFEGAQPYPGKIRGRIYEIMHLVTPTSNQSHPCRMEPVCLTGGRAPV